MLHEIKNGKWVVTTPPKQGWLSKQLNGERLPWYDFVIGKKPSNITINGGRLLKARWEVWAGHQQSAPLCFMTGEDGRFYWWFEGSFYWENDGLSPADFLALARDRERRKQRQLERARASLVTEAQPGPRRGVISRDMRLAVFNRDGGRCVECGSNFDLQYDHIIPVSMGGATTVQNLQLLCAGCNQRKGGTLG